MTMAVFWNVLAIFLMTFVVANIALSAFFSLVSQQLLRVEVGSRRVVLWFVVLLPWVVGFFLSLFIFQSFEYGDSLINAGLPHWHHMTDFAWSSWHGVTVGLGMLYLVYQVGVQLKRLLVHQREIGALLGFSTCNQAGIYEIASDQAAAFSSGFWAKRCFVTTGLIDQLSPEEYAVVIQHEQAHLAANDPLKKWFFGFLASFFIRPVSQRLTLHMTLAMEQAADNAVQERGVSRLFVASTLVKIAKLNAENRLLQREDLVVNFGADVLEQRVYFLLDKLTLEPVHKGITFVLVVLLVVLSTSSVDGIHHVIETFFSH